MRRTLFRHPGRLIMLAFLAGSAASVGTARADSAPPMGSFDSVQLWGGSGWAYDPDAGAAPLEIHVYVDNVLFRIETANIRRDDLIASGIAPNAEHGFDFDLTGLSAGTHRVDVYAINVGAGSNPLLPGSPKYVTVPSQVARGDIDFVNASGGSGWAYDPDAGAGGRDPIYVHVYVDSEFYAQVLANDPRPDLVTAGVSPNPEHGFHFSWAGVKPGTHRVDIFAIDVGGSSYNPLLRNNPNFVSIPAKTVNRGWNPGLTRRRIANYLPWESDTYYESCPDDAGGCYPGLHSGFYTLSAGVGETLQACRTNSGNPFNAGSAGIQSCPFTFNWGSAAGGGRKANLGVNTSGWTSGLTDAIYLGFHENPAQGEAGPPPLEPYFGGENPGTIDRFAISLDLSTQYTMPVEVGQNGVVRSLLGAAWFVPAANRSVILELNLDAVSHVDPASGSWSTLKRVEQNQYCPPEWLCLYLGARYWGIPSLINKPRSLFVNWAEIARSLQQSGELFLVNPTTGARVNAIGAFDVTSYTGIEVLGRVNASMQVSAFRQRSCLDDCTTPP